MIFPDQLARILSLLGFIYLFLITKLRYILEKLIPETFGLGIMREDTELVFVRRTHTTTPAPCSP